LLREKAVEPRKARTTRKRETWGSEPGVGIVRETTVQHFLGNITAERDGSYGVETVISRTMFGQQGSGLASFGDRGLFSSGGIPAQLLCFIDFRFIRMKRAQTQVVAINAAGESLKEATELSWQKNGPRITRITTDERLKSQILSVVIRVIRGSFYWLRGRRVVF
jgi:hypothetical protein